MPAAATPPTPDTIQCFKPGRHVAMSGATLAFAASDLAATAAAYDPALHEAPLVVGHPTVDAPAYGWVQSLSHEGGALEAKPRQVNPAFADLVNGGAYKKVSCAFWAPDAPGNPVPGVYYLRHVGFLGGAAPAVAGLRPLPEFAGGEDGVVEFSAWDDQNNASLWRGLRDWLLGKFGQDEADRAVPAWLVTSVEQGAQVELHRDDATDAAAPLPAFAAGLPRHPLPAAAAAASHQEPSVDPKTAQALTDENAALKKQLADQATAARQSRLTAAKADAVAFASGLLAKGVLADGEHDLVVTTVLAVATQEMDSGQSLMFSQADGKPAAVLPALKALLAALPVRAPMGRVATVAFAADGEAANPSLMGSTSQRRAAIAGMFPDLPKA
jgi:hypothetical protein